MGFMYEAPPDDLEALGDLRWTSPSLSGHPGDHQQRAKKTHTFHCHHLLDQLDQLIKNNEGESISRLSTKLQMQNKETPPIDRIIIDIVRLAEARDGCTFLVNTSTGFLAFLREALRRPKARLTLSTIHGAKGSEYPNVLVFKYNLLGGVRYSPFEGGRRCPRPGGR
jgi:hypothetical protein